MRVFGEPMVSLDAGAVDRNQPLQCRSLVWLRPEVQGFRMCNEHDHTVNTEALIAAMLSKLEREQGLTPPDLTLLRSKIAALSDVF
ncbi:peroxidase [Microcella alkaliphila]|uniref:Peroxidase n=1 Tax=Microcella alkaliphila TaxID=279828 RepID=A0A0U5B9W5_9MICO|nr:peroxidase [Microcella alkaliphila]